MCYIAFVGRRVQDCLKTESVPVVSPKPIEVSYSILIIGDTTMKFIKAKKPISANHKKLGELSVDGVEVPQYESLAEFVQSVKGDANALDYINGQVATGAKNVGRAMLRNAEDTVAAEKQTQTRQDPTDPTKTVTVAVFPALYKSVADAVRSYVPSADASSVSIKSKAEQRDALKAALESGKTLTREDLLAMLA